MKEFFSKNNFAQGTIEYLVIIAIVVIIGLVVVSMATTVFDSQNITSKNSELGNKIGTGGISVLEAALDDEGDGLIRIKNTSPDRLTLERFLIDGVEQSYSNLFSGFGEGLFSFSTIGTNCACVTPGKQVNCELVFYVHVDKGGSK